VIPRLAARRRAARLAPRRPRALDRLLATTAPGRRLAARLAARLEAADLHRTPAEHLRLVGATAVGGAVAAALWAGPAAALLGLVAGAAGPEVALRRRVASRGVRLAAQLPETLAAMAAPLRAGASLPQALAAAAEEAEPPIAGPLARTVRDLEAGVPQPEALARFAARAGVDEAALAARALRVGRMAGVELARVLDEVAEALRDRERIARELRAATAQARASAAVVALLPIAFLVLSSAGSADQVRFLLGEPAGWGLLVAGGALEAVGVWWIRRIGQAAVRRAGAGPSGGGRWT
jgi:tight adherence protein B